MAQQVEQLQQQIEKKTRVLIDLEARLNAKRDELAKATEAIDSQIETKTQELIDALAQFERKAKSPNETIADMRQELLQKAGELNKEREALDSLQEAQQEIIASLNKKEQYLIDFELELTKEWGEFLEVANMVISTKHKDLLNQTEILKLKVQTVKQKENLVNGQIRELNAAKEELMNKLNG